MPPLARQRTAESVQSWWSDSNPTGATISIHAAAKPLMKIMYHVAAVEFIKKDRDVALSRQSMDIYLRYLAYKYVSPATKAAIVRHLNTKTSSEDASRIVLNSLMESEDLVRDLLSSPDPRTRRRTCWLLGNLTQYESTMGKLLALDPCVGLFHLLSDEDKDVQSSAMYALSKIGWWEDGARAVLQEDALRLAELLLHSPDARTRAQVCWLFGNLAYHQSTIGAILSINPRARLVVLLSDADKGVVESATYALAKISWWEGSSKI
ncbi:armadillo-type protein [Mycena crocata]|nr:armadillo-type protein [Mycena crocata]